MSTRTITLRPGECAYIPKGATITSMIIDGDGQVTSDCDNLPEPSSYKCGYFVYVRDDASGAGPFDEGVTVIKKLTVGTTTFTMEEDATNPTATALNSHITDTALFQFTAETVAGDYSDRKYIALYFQVPEDLFDQCKLQLDERNNGAVLITLEPIEYDCDLYDVEV